MDTILKLIARLCCKPPHSDFSKDAKTIDEQNDKQIEELRTDIKNMLESQHEIRKPAELEDVLVEIDYLPVYEERDGRLQFSGTQAEILFSEARLRTVV
jgi:hypothetical protein